MLLSERLRARYETGENMEIAMAAMLERDIAHLQTLLDAETNLRQATEHALGDTAAERDEALQTVANLEAGIKAQDEAFCIKYNQLVARMTEAEETLAALRAWTYGRSLRDPGPDTYGEGMRDAKAQVKAILQHIGLLAKMNLTEASAERIGWVKIQDKKLVYSELVSGPLTQAQLNCVCDLYKTTGEEVPEWALEE